MFQEIPFGSSSAEVVGVVQVQARSGHDLLRRDEFGNGILVYGVSRTTLTPRLVQFFVHDVVTIVRGIYCKKEELRRHSPDKFKSPPNTSACNCLTFSDISLQMSSVSSSKSIFWPVEKSM